MVGQYFRKDHQISIIQYLSQEISVYQCHYNRIETQLRINTTNQIEFNPIVYRVFFRDRMLR